MPGIISTVNTRSGTTSPGVEAGTFFVAGVTERGRTDVLGTVRSMAEYASLYGDRVTFGTFYDHLRVFFDEGGALARVIRVVGPAAAAGELVLVDGEAVDSMTLTARGAGAWSSSLDVVVAVGALPDTVRITLTYGDVTELYDNIASAADGARILNLRSVLVSAVSEGGDLPVATVEGTPLNLSAGDDDRDAIGTTNYITALTTYAGPETGPGAVAVPGQLAAVIGPTLLPYAKDATKIALMAPAITSTASAVKTDAAALLATPGSEYGGIFYPAITISHNGALIDISPEGYVAGVRARTVALAGPWRAPAGDIAKSRTIISLVDDVDTAAGNALDASHVSVIRTLYGSSRLYGWRSLSTNVENYSLLTSADVINHVLRIANRALEPLLFENIDSKGQLFARAYGVLVGELQPIALDGGLYALSDADGEEIDPGYSVVTDGSVNTPETLQLNELHASIAIRPSPSAALIKFSLTKTAVSASV
jgi:hypothetical protein